jgi:Bifunctional DNA primase/polymerase, N-terminal
MTPLAIALELAAQGLPVFPCGASKKPCIPEAEGGHGFHDASADPGIIRQLFSHRGAKLVGVPTGERSGLDALDFDYRAGASSWEQVNAPRLPKTRTHETKSRGRHLLFLHAPGVRNSASKKSLAPGVDVRGEGGYIIHPPSAGYRVISDATPAHWPDWLLALVLQPAQQKLRPAAPAVSTPASSDLLQKVIDGALARVRNAPNGSKHFTLRNNALLLGGIASRAGFNSAEMTERLLAALPDGVADLENARKTAEWGLLRGASAPVVLREEPDHQPKPSDPRRKETAADACRLLRRGIIGPVLLATLHTRNRERPDPLPDNDIAKTAAWATQQVKDIHHAA